MNNQQKILITSISIVLASGSGWSATSAIEEPNKKAFPIYAIGTVEGSRPDGLIGTGRRIATDGKGNFLAIWIMNNTVYGRYTRNGKVLGDIFEIGNKTLAYGLDQRLSVAMNANGNAVACWLEKKDNSYRRMTFCRLVPAGTTADNITTVPITIDNDSGFYTDPFRHWHNGPSVAMDNNGEFIVAWADDSDPITDTNGSLFVRRYQANGIPKDIARLLVAGPDSNLGEGISVSIDPDGNGPGTGGDAIIVWCITDIDAAYNEYNFSHIFMRRIHNNGEMGTVLRVDLNADYSTSSKAFKYDARTPDVAMNGTGSFVVGWGYAKKMYLMSNGTADWTEAGVFAQRFDATDTPLNTNKKTGALGDIKVFKTDPNLYQLEPRVAINSTGNFILSWEKTIAYCRDHCYPISKVVFFRQYDAASSKFGGSKSNKFGKFSSSPSVAFDDDGNFEVMWTGTQRRSSSYPGEATYFYYEDTPMARFYPANKK